MEDRRSLSSHSSLSSLRSIARSVCAFAVTAAAASGLVACDPPSKMASSQASGGAADPRGAPVNSPVIERPASSAASGGDARTDPPKPPAASDPPIASSPPPLAAPGPFLVLPIEGHPPAILSVPLGATTRRPIIIAAHGNFDRPEWQCQVWREIAGDSAFILCPRGLARRDSPAADDIRFTYADNQALERELRAGLDALRALFPAHVDPGPILYTGFSLGAITGVSIAGRDPALFPRAVLIEGGHDKWTPAAVAAFARGGGKRVLFACGQAGCVAGAKQPAALLEKAGVASRVVHGKGVGHSYTGAVADEVKRAFEWVVEGDDRFSPPPPLPTLPRPRPPSPSLEQP